MQTEDDRIVKPGLPGPTEPGFGGTVEAAAFQIIQRRFTIVRHDLLAQLGALQSMLSRADRILAKDDATNGERALAQKSVSDALTSLNAVRHMIHYELDDSHAELEAVLAWWQHAITTSTRPAMSVSLAITETLTLLDTLILTRGLRPVVAIEPTVKVRFDGLALQYLLNTICVEVIARADGGAGLTFRWSERANYFVLDIAFTGPAIEVSSEMHMFAPKRRSGFQIRTQQALYLASRIADMCHIELAYAQKTNEGTGASQHRFRLIFPRALVAVEV